MLEFKPIVSQDYERYNKYRAFDKTDASEGVFATLYIWDAYYNLEVAENGEFLFFRFNVKNRKPSFFFPIGKGDIKKAVDELSDYCMARNEKLIFRLVSRENAELLEKMYPDRFELREARDSYDYVYLSEKMISLSLRLRTQTLQGYEKTSLHLFLIFCNIYLTLCFCCVTFMPSQKGAVWL